MLILRSYNKSSCIKNKKENLFQTGFTLLEVMVAMSIIAIALSAVLGSQSQSVYLATDAKFSTTAALLAQGRIAELASTDIEKLASGSGDFGDDFSGYAWEVTIKDAFFYEPERVSDYLKQIDLSVYWGEDKRFQYNLRRYLFFQKAG